LHTPCEHWMIRIYFGLVVKAHTLAIFETGETVRTRPETLAPFWAARTFARAPISTTHPLRHLSRLLSPILILLCLGIETLLSTETREG